MSKADIGLIGLAVMGQNCLEMNDHGFTVAVIQPHRIQRWTSSLNQGAKGNEVIGSQSLEELVNSLLKRPGACMLMVQAGQTRG